MARPLISHASPVILSTPSRIRRSSKLCAGGRSSFCASSRSFASIRFCGTGSFTVRHSAVNFARRMSQAPPIPAATVTLNGIWLPTQLAQFSWASSARAARFGLSQIAVPSSRYGTRYHRKNPISAPTTTAPHPAQHTQCRARGGKRRPAATRTSTRIAATGFRTARITPAALATASPEFGLMGCEPCHFVVGPPAMFPRAR
ncbi:hypothetical protein SALBM311S_10411 [Streptomyces alboniger]